MPQHTLSFASQWEVLTQTATAPTPSIATLLTSEPQRVAQLTVTLDDCYVDLSRQSFDLSTWNVLCDFAKSRGIMASLRAWFYGEAINKTEGRAANHQLYRHLAHEATDAFSKQALTQAQWEPDAGAELARMQQVATRIRQGQWLGATSKPITTVINIGIGGSHLGVEAAYQALAPYHVQDIKAVFVANIDPQSLQQALRGVDLERSVCIFASKSGTTSESHANLKALKHAFAQQGITDYHKHLLGATAHPPALEQLGIPKDQIFSFPESIGGRFSLFSPIGLLLAICVKPDALRAMRQGAALMDAHTISSPLERNMPVMLALATLWQHSIKGIDQHAILAYSHGLRGIVQHLQQLVMESNGKRLTQEGATAPPSGEVIWGGECSNGQHSYFQLLHQGNRRHHCDLLLFARPLGDGQNMQDALNAMALGQMQAFTYGNTVDGAESSAAKAQLAYPGNIPVSVVCCKQLCARTLGMLLALYENRTIAHALLLGINPFDQWGVEHGKQCARVMSQAMQDTAAQKDLDPSMQQVLHRMTHWKAPIHSAA